MAKEKDGGDEDEDERRRRRLTLSRMRDLALTQKERLLLGVALSTATSALGLIFPKAVGLLLDAAISPGATSTTAATTAGAPGDSASAVPESLAGVVGEGSTSSLLSGLELLPLDEAAAMAAGGDTALLCGGLFSVALVQSALAVARTRVLVTAGENVSATLREAALKNLVRQDIAFFDEEDSAELVNRLSADTNQLKLLLRYARLAGMLSLSPSFPPLSLSL